MPRKSKATPPEASESSIDLTQDAEDRSSASRLRWTDEMHEALLESLLTQFHIGKGTDGGGFKSEAWTAAVDAVRRVTQPDNGVAEELACRNKWAWFKDTWKNFGILEGMSGFGWDNEAELFKADKEVRNGIAKVRTLCTG